VGNPESDDVGILDVDGNIKMDLTDAGCENMDWIQLAQDGIQWRFLVNTVMKLRFTKMQ
jgi:hypothetical protein